MQYFQIFHEILVTNNCSVSVLNTAFIKVDALVRVLLLVAYCSLIVCVCAHGVASVVLSFFKNIVKFLQSENFSNINHIKRGVLSIVNR